MNKPIKTKFIPIKIIPFMESSIIFQGISEKEGIISLLAKGYKRPKSKLRGEIDIFSVSEVLFFNRETREIHTIHDAKLVESYHDFISDFKSVKMCSVIGKIVLKTTSKDTAASVFALYGGLLKEVSRLSVCKRSLYYGISIKLLRVHGLFPKITRCIRCGSTAVKYLSFNAKGALCEQCAKYYGDSTRLYEGILKEMMFLLTKTYMEIGKMAISESTVNIIKEMLKEHLEYNEEDKKDTL